MSDSLNRRTFLGHVARTAAAGAAIGRLHAVAADSPATQPAVEWRNRQPTMTYARLGRTNFMTSRCVFGAGGLFRRGGELRLLELAIEKGLNYIDTGRAYGEGEAAISGVVKKHRDRVFVVSKAAHIGWPDMQVREGDGTKAARMYTDQLEGSLRALDVETIDCYMVQGVQHEWIVTMDELYAAFEKARKAGKVRFYGLATHTNVPTVCERASKSGRYDVIMLAVNPSSLKDLSPSIQTMRRAGIGVVSMKASGAVQKDPKACDGVYGEMFEGRALTAYQRANAYLLFRGGIDAFNSHMPNERILLENLAIPTLKLGRAALDRLEKVAVAETAGACRHCGACSRSCPNGVPVADLLRCHAYRQNYRDPWMAADLYAAIGAARVERCSGCGECRRACPQAYDLPAVVASVTAAMA